MQENLSTAAEWVRVFLDAATIQLQSHHFHFLLFHKVWGAQCSLTEVFFAITLFQCPFKRTSKTGKCFPALQCCTYVFSLNVSLWSTFFLSDMQTQFNTSTLNSFESLHRLTRASYLSIFPVIGVWRVMLVFFFWQKQDNDFDFESFTSVSCTL